ncbi:3-deoxy-D-manno-octulosonate 8-phosphate phosphatase [Nonomuraea coxensis DSM 45129]|uniref:3-deoxy-D-manno-octulosonate 8-phosphate phosphatase n=1 Tax=Nonomuraea coxensis DSM 45129 TaxID=1122611 RepID=A0ABX8U682_9ACTN|nr:HAD hydrolase family protein [Nonomuraea coxensis]QYC42147.1 3-deoxy-D-manno-octulosonate 8-phosphate phosphatase [Nonomuraea coxensis DSM 45129]
MHSLLPGGREEPGIVRGELRDQRFQLPAGVTEVSLDEVAAVGDNPNDFDVIAAAGLGVAVGDGHPGVGAAAGTVVRACADGAVADVVGLAFRANGWCGDP